MTHHYTTVFIDWDDTLWDFHANAYASLSDMFVKYKLSQYFGTFEHFMRLYTFRNKQLWDKYGRNEITKEFLHKERFLYPFRQVNAPTTEEFSATIGNDFLMTTTTKTRLVPFAKDLLEYLAPKYALSVLSNGFSEVQYRKIHASGLESYFKHVILSEQVGVQKPDAKMFEYALAQNGSTAQQTIMIGDNYATDIIGAKNCGIAQIYFYPQPTMSADVQATFIVKSLNEITKIL